VGRTNSFSSFHVKKNPSCFLAHGKRRYLIISWKSNHRPFIVSFQTFEDMSHQHTRTKRARTENQDGAGGADNLPGREQLLLTSPELQTRVGIKFVDEAELVPLLLAHGLIRRVRTIQIEVRPLGGDSFKVTLDASKPTVGVAKAEIARAQGTAEPRQELYKIAERADGLAVREDDAEPELLEDESVELEEGDVVAMAVKVSSVPSATIFRCAAS
jgi:hypothetical protein